jgi:hypothetical protein
VLLYEKELYTNVLSQTTVSSLRHEMSIVY